MRFCVFCKFDLEREKVNTLFEKIGGVYGISTGVFPVKHNSGGAVDADKQEHPFAVQFWQIGNVSWQPEHPADAQDNGVFTFCQGVTNAAGTRRQVVCNDDGVIQRCEQGIDVLILAACGAKRAVQDNSPPALQAAAT